MTAGCRLSRWTETYLDGELSPEHTVDFEDHLSDCCTCQTKLKFDRALRFSMRRSARVATYPSTGFEAKLRAVLMAEGTIAESGIAEGKVHPRPLTWRSITPLSVAAAAALVFAAMRNEPGNSGAEYIPAGVAGNSVASKDTMQTVRDFLDQLAADTEHNVESSPTLVEEDETNFLPSPRPPTAINVFNGHRIPLPRFEDLGVTWVGHQYRNVPQQGRLPILHYRIGSHRVLLWVYDSQRVPLRVLLEPHVARNHPVFVGTHHGFAVAAVEKHGFGLAATTDLTQSEAAELVAKAAPAQGW